MQRLYLVGFMGSGKSTVGRIVAERLGWSFVDLDAEIERREARSVPDIFRDDGEGRFREIEAAVLRSVSESRHSVVALGGGTYVDLGNRDFIEKHGVTVHLEASLETVLERVPIDGTRPLFSGPGSVRELYRTRLPSYRMASMTVVTDGLDPAAIADRVLGALNPS